MKLSAITRFLHLQSTSGMLIILAAGLSLACANLPWLAPIYRDLLHAPVEVRIGALALDKNVLLVINDGLMAIFFLLVSLEIKRELLGGELKGKLALPVAAAIGGIVAPSGIYAAISAGDPVAARGWAIPAATDIAFALGVLALLGSRVPIVLKAFLTALAVFDDLAAIIIIAIFYTEDLSLLALALACVGVGVLFVLNRRGVTRRDPYLLVGALMWLCVLKSGVHATLAGVAVGLAVPYSAPAGSDGKATSPSVDLEHRLHPWVAFAILPLFAFANAGVSFAGLTAETVFSATTMGIAAGLLFGKPIGILGACAVATRLGVARLPDGIGWRDLFGVSLLAGIGFTMSLFIGSLAFEHQGPAYEAATRLGVLSGSLVAATLGFAVLRTRRPPPTAT